MRDGYRHKLEGKFIILMASHRCSNRRLFDFEHLWWARQCVQRHDSRTVTDTYGGLVNVYRTHHQPGMTSG
jgi:hypothetical protein